jgi:hypothetical protein
MSWQYHLILKYGIIIFPKGEEKSVWETSFDCWSKAVKCQVCGLRIFLEEKCIRVRQGVKHGERAIEVRRSWQDTCQDPKCRELLGSCFL